MIGDGIGPGGRGMDPVSAGPKTTTMLESALKRHRLTLAVVVLGIPLVCWAWVVVMARDMYGPMTGASAWMMTTMWDAPHVALLWAMWAAMMAAMMLPSATPLILLHAGAARRTARHGAASIYAMARGYLTVWALFSVGATALQRILARRLLLTPMMEPAVPALAATVLLVAGAYQLTPLKRVCLRSCRSPLSFMMNRWRPGPSGAFRIGLEHGAYCVGCCWALMLLLFAGGIMNLAVILALTAWVVVEKLAPFGERTTPVSGALLVGVGFWMLTR